MSETVAEAPPEQGADLGTETEVEEQTETELELATETELEHEPESAVRSERDIEQAMDKLARENERHAKRVAEVMGDDFATVDVCPLCEPFTAGWIFPGNPIPPEQWHAVQLSVGLTPEPVLRQNPDTETCALCGGAGDLLTGATNDRARTMGCPPCGGQGYTTRAPSMPASGGVVVQPEGGQAVYVPPGAPPPPAPVFDYATGRWVIP